MVLLYNFNLLFYRVVFKKVRALLGGRMRLVLTGGAPLSPDTHEQVKACLCVNVIQGYGLTETTSCATVMDGKIKKIKCLFKSCCPLIIHNNL